MKKQVFYIIIMGILFSISFELQAQINYSGCTATSSKQASAIGLNCTSTGDQSFASGNYATASGSYTTAFGRYVQATANNAFTFGSGASTSSYLSNATANSFLLGFNNTTVLFAQRHSTGTPRVGIGTKTPEYTLDVNGDANAANVYTKNLYFTGTEMRIGMKVNGPVSSPPDLKGTVDMVTLKQNGRVGIGTTSPEATLDVAGNVKAYFLDVHETGKMKKLELTGTPLPPPPDFPYLTPKHYLKFGEFCNFYHDGLGYTLNLNWFNGEIIQHGLPISSISLRDNGGVILSSSERSVPTSSNVYVDPSSIGIHTPKFIVKAKSYFNQNVGIIEENPQHPLHVNGNSYITGNVGIGSVPSTTYKLGVTGNTYISGNVGIGSAPSSTYKLGVNGKIGCKEIVVTNTGWADYVFEPDYELRSLEELETFILANNTNVNYFSC